MSSKARDVAAFIDSKCRDGTFPDARCVFDLVRELIGEVVGDPSTEDRISRGIPANLHELERATNILLLFERRRADAFKKGDASRVLTMTSLYEADGVDHPED